MMKFKSIFKSALKNKSLVTKSGKRPFRFLILIPMFLAVFTVSSPSQVNAAVLPLCLLEVELLDAMGLLWDDVEENLDGFINNE
ncbi:MAG: hypothetical protein KAJ40_02810, partial [Alphaproteobacteria bacterium]|nr:hypothetical protein [Alphaproteobacteria bacterium]